MTTEIETEEIQESQEPSVLRTRRNGVWEIYNGAWGSYLRSADDPDANIEITAENLKVFNLKPDLYKIPADLWTRWVKLCFHFVDKVPNELEVSVRILRSEEDSSKYRMLIPRQQVTGVAVHAPDFQTSVDIETGEELTQYPPSGWIPVGSSHSHNTMETSPSPTDDENELNDPGIHMIVGGIDVANLKYKIYSSVVGSGRRFEVPYSSLIDATPIHEAQFHPKVLDYVDCSPPPPKKYNTSIVPWSKSQYQKSLSYEYEEGLYGWNFEDPYHYSETFTPKNTFSNTNKSVAMWEIEDLISDYIHQNMDDANKLCIFADSLKDQLLDIEANIEQLISVA